MNVKLSTEHHFGFLSLKGGCTVSSESTLVKIPHCWKSHVTAHISMWRSLRKACTSTDAYQNFGCSHTQTMNVDEDGPIVDWDPKHQKQTKKQNLFIDYLCDNLLVFYNLKLYSVNIATI